MSQLPEGKKIIRIAAQKPKFVFGYANPDDTIQKWLSRSYSYGHVSTKQIARGFVPITGFVTAVWFTASYIVGKRPKTLSPEWKKATKQYNKDQGSESHFINDWKPGDPINIPTSRRG